MRNKIGFSVVVGILLLLSAVGLVVPWRSARPLDSEPARVRPSTTGSSEAELPAPGPSPRELAPLPAPTEPPPSRAAADGSSAAQELRALEHLAAAFGAGLARCDLAGAGLPAGAKPVLVGYPMVDGGDHLLVLAPKARSHVVDLDGTDDTEVLHLDWQRAAPGEVGACRAWLGPDVPPASTRGASLVAVVARDANGEVIPASMVSVTSESGFDYGFVGGQFQAALADPALSPALRSILVEWQQTWSVDL